MSEPSEDAAGITKLITGFVRSVPGVAHAVVASSSGAPLTFSDTLVEDRADQISALAANLASLSQKASGILGGGAVTKSVLDMERGRLLVAPISDQFSIAVLAASDCDLYAVAHQMTLVVERIRTSGL